MRTVGEARTNPRLFARAHAQRRRAPRRRLELRSVVSLRFPPWERWLVLDQPPAGVLVWRFFPLRLKTTTSERLVIRKPVQRTHRWIGARCAKVVSMAAR